MVIIILKKHKTKPSTIFLDFPDFGTDCKSLLSEFLTKSIFDQFKDSKDDKGYSFKQLINSGVVNIDSGIGV